MEHPIHSGFVLPENTAHASFAACPRVDNVGSGSAPHLPSYCANEGDGPGWPATGGRVSPDAGQPSEWLEKRREFREYRRSIQEKWIANNRERYLELKRAAYRRAKARKEARRAARG